MDSKLKTDLSAFNNDWFKTGKSVFVRTLWFIFQGLFFSSWLPGSSWRRVLLRIFGARIGKSVVIKPRAIVKYPWNLTVGDYSWIGEKVWIDNLSMVTIGAHCCISQGALLLCGNHNYKKASFDLITNPINLEDGVWIGARSMVTGGVVCMNHCVLSAGSIASKNLEAYTIYSGNPAEKIREREITS